MYIGWEHHMSIAATRAAEPARRVSAPARTFMVKVLVWKLKAVAFYAYSTV